MKICTKKIYLAPKDFIWAEIIYLFMHNMKIKKKINKDMYQIIIETNKTDLVSIWAS